MNAASPSVAPSAAPFVLPPAACTHAPLEAAPSAPTSHRVEARRALAAALTLGLATQALFWEASLGLDWLLWNLVLIAACFLHFRANGDVGEPRIELESLGSREGRGGRIGAAAWAIAIASLALAACVVLRRSDWTTWIAIPANVALLIGLPIAARRPSTTFRELGELPLRALRDLQLVPRAFVDGARCPVEAVDDRDRGRAKAAALGLLLGVPITGVFVALLASDPGFAAALTGAQLRLTSALGFAAASLATAACFLALERVQRRARDAAGTVEARGPTHLAPYRVETQVAAVPRRLSSLTWTIVIAQVAGVFGLFAFVHRRDFFGDHAWIRCAGTPTYARYLHAGFYELLAATLLAVCLVVVGHTLLRGADPEDQERAAGGAALTFAEATLLVTTGVALVSCRHRLALYEEAYGASYLRLGVGVVTIAIGGALAWALVGAIARRFRGFGAGLVSTLAALAIGAAAFDADGHVARTNLDRAARGLPLDEAYLARLGADACSALDHPVLRADPELRARLLARWSNVPGAGDPRSFRGLGSCRASAP